MHAAAHSGPAEITAVAQSGAGVVICPRTDANLGDGLGNLPSRLAAHAPIAIGSDSPVGRCWRKEMRGLDHGQRLALHRRNLRAAPLCDPPATAQRLFSRALQAGPAACGEAAWGLLVSVRADALVVDPGDPVDPADPTTLGIPPERWLDAKLFSSPALNRPCSGWRPSSDWARQRRRLWKSTGLRPGATHE